MAVFKYFNPKKKITFFGKRFPELDPFEKVVWERNRVGFETDHAARHHLVNLPVLKHAHHVDRWELFVESSIAMDKHSGSGYLHITPTRMKEVFNKYVDKMCGGIYTSSYKCKSGRKYYIGFDYND